MSKDKKNKTYHILKGQHEWCVISIINEGQDPIKTKVDRRDLSLLSKLFAKAHKVEAKHYEKVARLHRKEVERHKKYMKKVKKRGGTIAA